MDKDLVKLQKLEVQLQSWRAEHTWPSRLPANIWTQAAKLGSRLGLTKVAKVLRLDYSRLKQHVQQGCDKPAAVPTFVEVVTTPQSRCVVEVELVTGARMTIRMENIDSLSLAAIMREFVA